MNYVPKNAPQPPPPPARPPPAGPAVAGPRVGHAQVPQDICTLANFKAWGEYVLPYKAHSEALKFYRDYAEDSLIPAESDALLIPDGWHSIKECQHIHKTKYEFTDNDVTWNWLEMVAQLRDEDIVTLIGSSCGLTKCFMARRPNSYDHERHHAIKEQG